MWRFVLYQLCISSAVRHKRNILGVTRPFTFSGQNPFSHPSKSGVFHSQTHLGKQLGCMFSLGNWFSTVHTRKEVTLLKKQCALISMLGVHVIEHQSSYGLCLCHAPHREKSVRPQPLWKLQLVPSVYFQGWDTAGRYDGREPAIWVLLAKALLSPREIPMGWQRVQHDERVSLIIRRKLQFVAQKHKQRIH